jgi:hypothetical protein
MGWWTQIYLHGRSNDDRVEYLPLYLLVGYHG